MTTDSSTRLQGFTVLILRPLHQAERLAKTIEMAGGKTLVFPTIEIVPVADDEALRGIVSHLDSYQIAIFVSANAVEKGMPYVSSEYQIFPPLAYAAIGDKTKKALQAYGVGNILTPEHQFDSEGLLSLAQMQDVAGKRIVIFRGEGGREVLAQTLRDRGATVDYAECYRRVRSTQDAGQLLDFFRNRSERSSVGLDRNGGTGVDIEVNEDFEYRTDPNHDRAVGSERSLLDTWQSGNIHAVSAMSLESLANLCDILDESTRRMLVKTPVFVPHRRIAEGAETLGLTKVVVTGPSDEQLIEELSLLHVR